MNIKKTYPLALLLIIGSIGLGILAYLWKIEGDRGMYADASGTGGYITWGEIILGIFGFILFVGSSVCVLMILKKKREK